MQLDRDREMQFVNPYLKTFYGMTVAYRSPQQFGSCFLTSFCTLRCGRLCKRRALQYVAARAGAQASLKEDVFVELSRVVGGSETRLLCPFGCSRAEEEGFDGLGAVCARRSQQFHADYPVCSRGAEDEPLSRPSCKQAGKQASSIRPAQTKKTLGGSTSGEWD